MFSVRASLVVAASILVSLGCGSEAPAGSASGSSGTVKVSVSDGETFVKNRRCASCHTEDQDKPLAGVKTKLAGLDAQYELYPPNLTPDVETGIGGWNDLQLGEAIRNGVDNDGVYLCPQMKHFADMSDSELGSIIAYLRALAPVKNVIKQSVCPPLKFAR